MKSKYMKPSVLTLSVLAFLLVGFSLLIGLGESSTPAQAKKVAIPDQILGDTNAPITLIEYASFTCSHCAHFNKEIMPEIKKRYIDTGKVKLIYRDFPMDGLGLRASALSRCIDDDQYYAFVKATHNSFSTWIKAEDPIETLKQYAHMFGLSPEKADACLGNTDLLDALVEMRQEGEKTYNIKATPTFIFNNGEEKLVGGQPITSFTQAIDKLLEKQENK